MEQIFITDIEGKKFQVTDLDAAITQAKNAVEFNEEKISNNDEIQFPKALLYWKHALTQLEALKMDGVTVVGEEKKSTLTDNKEYNTLKMMGVSGRDALVFVDSLKSMRNLVGKETTKYYRNNILNTVAVGKTFREWYQHFLKAADKNRHSKGLPEFFTKNFDIDDTGISHLKALLELVMQEYYKKEYFSPVDCR